MTSTMHLSRFLSTDNIIPDIRGIVESFY